MRRSDRFQRHQVDVAQTLERWREGPQFLLLVNEFDDERQGAGQVENAGQSLVLRIVSDDDTIIDDGIGVTQIARVWVVWPAPDGAAALARFPEAPR